MQSVILTATSKKSIEIDQLKNTTDKSKWDCKQCSSNPQEGRKNTTVKCKWRIKYKRKHEMADLKL